MSRKQNGAQLDWERYKATLQHLYVTKDQSLGDVRKNMIEQYGFIAS